MISSTPENSNIIDKANLKAKLERNNLVIYKIEKEGYIIGKIVGQGAYGSVYNS